MAVIISPFESEEPAANWLSALNAFQALVFLRNEPSQLERRSEKARFHFVPDCFPDATLKLPLVGPKTAARVILAGTLLDAGRI